MRENGSLPWEYFLRWGRSNRHSTGVRTEEGAVLTSWEEFDWAAALFLWIPPDTTKGISVARQGDVYGDSSFNSPGNSPSGNWSSRTWLLPEMSDICKGKATFLSLDIFDWVRCRGNFQNFTFLGSASRVPHLGVLSRKCVEGTINKIDGYNVQRECFSTYYWTHMHRHHWTFWYPGPLI